MSVNLHFSIVEDPEVVKLVQLLRPNSFPPSCKRIIDLLNAKYGAIQQGQLPGLGEHTKVFIAVDCWTSPKSYAFVAVVCYYVSEKWEYKEVLIGFEPDLGSHRGQNLAQVIKQVLPCHKLCHRHLAVTSDNASNNDTVQQSLSTWLESEQISWNPDMMRIHC